MPNFKGMFSTPKKAAVSIACLLVILVTAGVCIGIVYAGSTNSAAENSSIGNESAQNFAFADAGVDPASAQAVKVKFERFQGEFVYEVEFIAENTEYEYKINAADGSVVKKELKTVEGPGSTGQLPAAVTLEDAREIALADAGVSREQATFTEVEGDTEGGVPVYEFQFYAGNVEYEYEINGQTGAIYSKKTTTYVTQDPGVAASAPPRQTNPPTAQSTQAPTAQPPQPTPEPTQAPAVQPTQPPATAAPQPTSQPQQGGKLYIGADAAKNAALSDAGLSAGQVWFTEVRMDYEDGVAVYELEFRTSTHEYEYEINAQTGAVYSRDMDAYSFSGGDHHSEEHHSEWHD